MREDTMAEEVLQVDLSEPGPGQADPYVGGTDPYVGVEADQPVWQNLGADH
jgi:hypothetical protein